MWRMTPFCAHPVGRRTVLKTGWALAALEIASAFHLAIPLWDGQPLNNT